MGHTLFFKLLGAFAIVIVVLAITTTMLVNKAVEAQFQNYSDRSGQYLAENLAPALADYYSRNNTWEGVSGVLHDPLAMMSKDTMTTSGAGLPGTITPPPSDPLITPAAPYTVDNGQYFTQPTAQSGVPGGAGEPTAPEMGMGRRGMGMGMTSGGSVQPGLPTPVGIQTQPSAGPSSPLPALANRNGMGNGMRGRNSSGGTVDANLWSMLGQRVIVVDAAGRVVTDSSGESSGQVLSSEQLMTGETIQVAGQQAGTVLVEAGETVPGTPAGEFLSTMNQSILIAVLAAGTLALVLGSLLFFQITAPVRMLKTAASAIARGDLSQRVNVQTKDELGELGTTFNQMAESLKRAETQRRQMVADVAHELRTPLSVMQANLEAMQDGVLPLDAEEIASLHEETILLSRLVTELHLLSLAEAGQLKLERVKLEPGLLVRKATERLQQKAQERGVTVNVVTGEQLPPVLVDAGRLSQVIGNLVANALRHTSPGGVVTVKAEALNGASPGSPNPGKLIPAGVLVSVTDTGSGIAQADLPHIFDRFFRADKARTRASGGSGLGLAIVKHMIEAHGGKVWAESPVDLEPGTQTPGTRISFTLPQEKPI